jgi:hypothetical protein
MKTALGSLVLALATAASSAPTMLRHQGLLRRFSSLVVFGDSYTDNGVYSYIPPVAPQSNETSTGGRAWPSYVQQYSGVNLYDYAVSGAVCDSVTANTRRSGIKQDQMSSFLTDNSYRDNRTGSRALINPSDETVYAIWIGTNDLGYGGFLTEVQPDGMPLTYFTDCVYEQLDRLHAVGARAFVLMNIAPLDLCPEYARPENGGEETGQYWANKAGYDTNVTRSSEKMRQYFTMVNEVFEYRTPFELLLANRYPGSRFAVYDVHALVGSPLVHLSSFFFTFPPGYGWKSIANSVFKTADD